MSESGHVFYSATVVRIIDASDVVKRFVLRMPDTVPFTFMAGQFVMLDLPISIGETYRSYSIASPPSGNNEFELCISLKEDGLATPWLWENVQVGSTLRCTAALGKFVLPETIDTDICFICTGTGIAPLRSMILDIYNRNLPHRNVYLVFGNRYAKDILYRDEFEALSQQHPDFHFLPALSREADAAWTGTKGYVHPLYESLFADHRPAQFYLCGWKAMVREAKEKLKAMGYSRKQIQFELYD